MTETTKWTHCTYCEYEIPVDTVAPATSDDVGWSDLSVHHSAKCEWVLTRAHRITPHGASSGAPTECRACETPVLLDAPTDTKHSPTPYKLVGDKGGISRVADEFNDVIIRSVRNITSDDEWRATAAFIVRACNEHDGLVEQRDHLVEILEMILEAHNGKAPLIDMGVALLIAPAAIAQAKEKP